MCKVSIIVTVYNIEKYLEECIDSLINQTYQSIEIILVNDGSTDGSLEICNKYEKVNENIKVINQKNAGLSVARNVGVYEATGKYITFVDGDDWLKKDAIRTLVWLMEENDADISSIIREGHQYSSGEIIIGDDKRMLLHLFNTQCFEVWGKLYKKELFNSIRFPEGKIHEDLYIIPSLIAKCSKVVIYHKGLYYYRQREESIMSQVRKSDFKELVECCIEGVENTYKLGDDISLIYSMQKWYFYHILWYYYNVIYNMSDNIKKTATKNISYFYKKTRKRYFLNKKISIKDKIRFFILSCKNS